MLTAQDSDENTQMVEKPEVVQQNNEESSSPGDYSSDHYSDQEQVQNQQYFGATNNKE